MANLKNDADFPMKITRQFACIFTSALLLMGSFNVKMTLAAVLIGGRYRVEVETAPGSNQYSLLGSVFGFTTDGSLEEFYDYRDFKYNGIPLNFQPDQAHIFLVNSSKTGEFGLFSINGSPLETSTSYIWLQYSVNNGVFTRLAVADEPSEIPFPQTPPLTTPFEQIDGLFGWCNQFNDGAVLPYIGNDPQTIFSLQVKVVSLFSQFDGQLVSNCPVPVKKIDSMVFLSAQPNGEIGIGPDFMFEQDLEDGLSFRITPENIAEPSATKGILWLGFLGCSLVWLKRLR